MEKYGKQAGEEMPPMQNGFKEENMFAKFNVKTEKQGLTIMGCPIDTDAYIA